MTSASFDVKFINIEHFTIEDQTEFKNLPKENFGNFELQSKNHKVYVVNSSNKTPVASFVGDKITYGYEQNEKYFYNIIYSLNEFSNKNAES